MMENEIEITEIELIIAIHQKKDFLCASARETFAPLRLYVGFLPFMDQH